MNFGLQHYNNEFNTFDESGKAVKDKFSKKSFSNWEVNFSYNKLIVRDDISYWSVGLSYVETSNIDDLSTKTYKQTIPITNTKDTLTTRK